MLSWWYEYELTNSTSFVSSAKFVSATTALNAALTNIRAGNNLVFISIRVYAK